MYRFQAALPTPLIDMTEDVHIGVGSNLGDRQAYLQFAADRLTQLSDTKLISTSRVYETDPLGPGGQDAYLNAVYLIRTGQSPYELLESIRSIEADANRQRSIHWGPRTLDLDILFFGTQMIQSDDLIIPHPEIVNRWFVLQPLCDIDASLPHPATGELMHDLVAGLATSGHAIGWMPTTGSNLRPS